jgi:hypothetical protein|tara:strand:- start:377 stop:769 length:393 start_codon:yes stop_codon:yes gene_type:complete
LNTTEIQSISNARSVIQTILKQTLDNPDNPESLNFFQADTYRFYFLMSFMWEHLEDNEMSQEYAISLVPKKYASRIKRLQILKQAVALGYIDEKASSSDKRRRIYKPTERLIQDFLKYTNSLYNQNTSSA